MTQTRFIIIIIVRIMILIIIIILRNMMYPNIEKISDCRKIFFLRLNSRLDRPSTMGDQVKKKVDTLWHVSAR